VTAGAIYCTGLLAIGSITVRCVWGFGGTIGAGLVATGAFVTALITVSFEPWGARVGSPSGRGWFVIWLMTDR
jgi:hypothetical protein